MSRGGGGDFLFFFSYYTTFLLVALLTTSQCTITRSNSVYCQKSKYDKNLSMTSKETGKLRYQTNQW